MVNYLQHAIHNTKFKQRRQWDWYRTSSGRGRDEAPLVVNKRKPQTKKLKIATWNIRSLKETGKQHMLCEEMDRLNIDVMGLAETYIKANTYTLGPTKRNERTYKLYASDCDDKGRKGVGFLICDMLDQRVINVASEGPNVIGINLDMGRKCAVLIQVYIPDISAKKEEVEKCYGKVEKVMTQLNTGKNRQVVIMRDFNGRIGCKELNGITGKYGNNEINRNGRSFVEFCEKLVAKNTFLSIKKSKNYTWKSDSGKGQSLIDYITINKKYEKYLRKCKVIHKVDKLSDHDPVIGTLKVHMQRIKKPKREDRIDVGWLRQTENKHQFRKYVEEQEITGENTWVSTPIKQRLKIAANNCIPNKKRNKKKNWITDEITELMNQRRNENDQRAVNELTKTIPRKCREAKDEEIEQKC